jgi:hypothetical protein
MSLWEFLGTQHNKHNYFKLNKGFILKNCFLYEKKGCIFKTLTNTLISIVSCYPFQLPSQFIGSCFCHVLPKVIQYDINDAKV